MYIVDEIKTLINIIVKYYVITSHSGQNVKIFFLLAICTHVLFEFE